MPREMNVSSIHESLHQLQAELSDFHAGIEDLQPGESPMTLARDWSARFAMLGSELNRLGYSRHVINMTIGLPVDCIAIDVLRLACVAGAVADHEPLSARLEVILSGTVKSRQQILGSLQNMLHRLAMLLC